MMDEDLRKVSNKKIKFIFSTAGIGDAYVLRSVIDEIYPQWQPDYDVILVCNYPEIWEGWDKLPKISMWEMQNYYGEIPKEYNIYAFLSVNPELKLPAAYKKLYERAELHLNDLALIKNEGE
jgi:hypothetical protein